MSILKIVPLIIAVTTSVQMYAQEAQPSLDARLVKSAEAPAKLLSTRSIVAYKYTVTKSELSKIQETFSSIGVDAVAYFDQDLLTAGKDVSSVMNNYLTRRDIMNIVFIDKSAGEYAIKITAYNNKPSYVDEGQQAWMASANTLDAVLKSITRACNSLPRKNLLVNPYPEMDLPVNPIAGRRSEFFAIDLKVDKLAVPLFGDEQADAALKEIFASYPFKFDFTEPGLSEKELRDKGYMYVLCYLHTRGRIARDLLGYQATPSETALASVTFDNNAEAQVRHIPAERMVYKFYFKHITSGNVFLGTKWDADVTWQQALTNHLMAFKAELKLN